MEENTLVFFLSDNGGTGTGSDVRNMAGLRATKGSVCEGGIRVPMIVKGPGIKAGTRVKGNIYLMDALATFCDLTGVETPKTP